MAFVCKANECECGNVSCFHLQRHLLCAIEKAPPPAYHYNPLTVTSTQQLQQRRDLLTYVACTPFPIHSSAALPLATLMMIGLCAATCCSCSCCCSKCVCTHSGYRQKQLHAIIDKEDEKQETGEGRGRNCLAPCKEGSCMWLQEQLESCHYWFFVTTGKASYQLATTTAQCQLPPSYCPSTQTVSVCLSPCLSLSLSACKSDN